jgi:hypothetical protein
VVEDKVKSQSVTHSRRQLLLEASAEEVDGEWWASYAIFNDDSEKALLYWMPSLLPLFATEQEAQDAAHTAGLRFIEYSMRSK